MLKCPREFYKKYIKGEEDEDQKSSASLDFGSYVHSIVLEPHLVEEEYAIFEGHKRGKAWDEFKSAHENKIILSASQANSANLLKDVMLENKEACSLTKDGVAEQTLCVELDGVKIKVRADYLKGDKIIDLKTTSNGVTYDEVQQTCLHWDYPLSAALYVDAFTEHTGHQHDFYFVFLGKSPMGCEVYKASDAFLEYGRKKYKKAIKMIKEGRESGHWFNNGIMEIDLPEGM
jgi:exodeoxyribonuclease VIII